MPPGRMSITNSRHTLTTKTSESTNEGGMMRLFSFHRYPWRDCAISLAGGFDLRILRWSLTCVPRAASWKRPSYWYVSLDGTPSTSFLGSRQRHWAP